MTCDPEEMEDVQAALNWLNEQPMSFVLWAENYLSSYSGPHWENGFSDDQRARLTESYFAKLIGNHKIVDGNPYAWASNVLYKSAYTTVGQDDAFLRSHLGADNGAFNIRCVKKEILSLPVEHHGYFLIMIQSKEVIGYCIERLTMRFDLNY